MIERANLMNVSKLLIKELIDSSLAHGRMLNDDYVPLQQFFVVLEHILRHGLKCKCVMCIIFIAHIHILFCVFGLGMGAWLGVSWCSTFYPELVFTLYFFCDRGSCYETIKCHYFWFRLS